MLSWRKVIFIGTTLAHVGLIFLLVVTGSSSRHLMPVKLFVVARDVRSYPVVSTAFAAAAKQLKNRPVVSSLSPSGSLVVTASLSPELASNNMMLHRATKDFPVTLDPLMYCDGLRSSSHAKYFPVASFSAKSVMDVSMKGRIAPIVGPRVVYFVK